MADNGSVQVATMVVPGSRSLVARLSLRTGAGHLRPRRLSSIVFGMGVDSAHVIVNLGESCPDAKPGA